MSKTIVLKKGLNLPITGCAEKRLSKTLLSEVVAVQPGDFKGLLPRLLVKEGDAVLAGSPVFSDKKNPDILITAPASGTVKAIVRGEKRKLLAVLIQTDPEQKYAPFEAKIPADAEGVKKALLASGLWPWLVQRPYGILADPAAAPKAIFVSAFNSTPGAADADFAFAGEIPAIQAGIDALAKIAEVHVSFNAKTYADSPLAKLNATKHFFEGKCPAGNVGVQISHISPIKKEETVWTISLQGLAAVGKLFSKGRYDVRRMVAVSGPMAIQPAYVSALPGTPMTALKAFYSTNEDIIRVVSGDVLSGKTVGVEGYLGYFDNTVTLIKEGTEKEPFGWARPLRWNQYSIDHTYFSWLTPWRKYDMDTNLHGGPRAFVMSDEYYAKVLPMDIYPLYLIKACLAGDIEKMEKFGIYEVLPEDLAVCEFVDPSKNYIQDIIAKGIDLMLKEMA
ncbi:MAG: Na(+)-translocating NADH-quinone reductase subunit A [Bacteroidales bacterium]|nr:Na(+)-translocating NADH-quinone reductase subunit A [Bacteroidales bacterium]